MIQFPPAADGRTELFGEPGRLSLLSLTAHIVVIDDEPANVQLLKRLLGKAGFQSVTGMTDPSDLETLIVASPPDLVITDLHMPERDGFWVLNLLTPLINQERLPVLMMTGDGSRESMQKAFTRGAKDFVAKPFDLVELLLRVRNLLESRMMFQDLRKQNRALRESALGSNRELESTRVEMIERLVRAAEYRDDQTNEHNLRVGDLSARLALELGFSPEWAGQLRRAAALHDIGKIGIPDALLRKTEPLTDGEWRVMRTHTTIGGQILGGSHNPILQLAESIALSHHENFDGSGYPNGLSGLDIPTTARIVAVADAFDAITNDRTYQKGQSPEVALMILRSQKGSHYEPRLVDALARVVRHVYAESSVAARSA